MVLLTRAWNSSSPAIPLFWQPLWTQCVPAGWPATGEYVPGTVVLTIAQDFGSNLPRSSGTARPAARQAPGLAPTGWPSLSTQQPSRWLDPSTPVKSASLPIEEASGTIGKARMRRSVAVFALAIGLIAAPLAGGVHAKSKDFDFQVKRAT